MDRQTILKTMSLAISNVMDTMFFEPVEIRDEDRSLSEWFSGNDELVGARLNFNGLFSGSCHLLMSMKLARELTANFLGIDETDTERLQLEDTIREALNIIAGHMFSILDKDGKIVLGIPELIDNELLGRDRLSEFEGENIFVTTEQERLAAGFNTVEV